MLKPLESIKIRTGKNQRTGAMLHLRKVIHHGADQVQLYRRLIQFGFLFVVMAIGIQFALFVGQLESGGAVIVSRPPGVEAFLPISALISLKYWLLTGIFNTIHPSALVILLIVLTLAIVLKKSFCSWVCPVGLLSEYLAKLHKFIFRKTYHLPRLLDYPLRGIKYLLLFFFVWAVFMQMDVLTLEKFLYSPYNKAADIKMLKFFTELSTVSFYVIAALLVLSALIPYFWCRYLCPYGALLGSVSIFSVFKIHRDENFCTDCGKCSRVCPSGIKVHTLRKVSSDECHGCLKCIDACPEKDALGISITGKRFRIRRRPFALAVVAVFVLGTALARILGHWQNSISSDEYRVHIQKLDDPSYQHNRGKVPDY